MDDICETCNYGDYLKSPTFTKGFCKADSCNVVRKTRKLGNIEGCSIYEHKKQIICNTCIWNQPDCCESKPDMTTCDGYEKR
jgi:hypothetical protein